MTRITTILIGLAFFTSWSCYRKVAGTVVESNKETIKLERRMLSKTTLQLMQGRWYHDLDILATLTIDQNFWTFNYEGEPHDSYTISFTDKLPQYVRETVKTEFLVLTNKTDTLQYEILGISDTTFSLMYFPTGRIHVYSRTITESDKEEIGIQSEKNTEDIDEFCDTTKILNFKTNLTPVSIELTRKEKEYQHKQAKDFITQSCERDTLFCGEIKLKIIKTYILDDEWKLLLTGYLCNQVDGMDENSASFFVLTIIRNNKPWFTDILEDLIGEIQVELNGFEDSGRQLTVWGSAFPYFQSDYGKFRLTIENGTANYEFECHKKH